MWNIAAEATSLEVFEVRLERSPENLLSRQWMKRTNTNKAEEISRDYFHCIDYENITILQK